MDILENSKSIVRSYNILFVFGADIMVFLSAIRYKLINLDYFQPNFKCSLEPFWRETLTLRVTFPNYVSVQRSIHFCHIRMYYFEIWFAFYTLFKIILQIVSPYCGVVDLRFCVIMNNAQYNQWIWRNT